MDTQQSAKPGGKRPWAAYNIIQRKDGEKPIWSRIGTAWENQDGSFNIYLDSFPIGGKLQIREDDRSERNEARRKGALATEAVGTA